MEALKTALETAFTSVQTETISIIGVALPAALAIIAVTMSLRIGIKFFKSVSKDA